MSEELGELRKFGPMQEKNALHYPPCAACGQRFKEGDYTTLIALGPGNDSEEQEKKRLGKPYTAVCAHVHWDCAY